MSVMTSKTMPSPEVAIVKLQAFVRGCMARMRVSNIIVRLIEELQIIVQQEIMQQQQNQERRHTHVERIDEPTAASASLLPSDASRRKTTSPPDMDLSSQTKPSSLDERLHQYMEATAPSEREARRPRPVSIHSQPDVLTEKVAGSSSSFLTVSGRSLSDHKSHSTNGHDKKVPHEGSSSSIKKIWTPSPQSWQPASSIMVNKGETTSKSTATDDDALLDDEQRNAREYAKYTSSTAIAAMVRGYLARKHFQVMRRKRPRRSSLGALKQAYLDSHSKVSAERSRESRKARSKRSASERQRMATDKLRARQQKIQSAAVKIQAIVRGFLIRNVALEEAMVVIEKLEFFRSLDQSIDQVESKGIATNRTASDEARRAMALRKVQLGRAAAVIQGLFRGHLVRKFDVANTQRVLAHIKEYVQLYHPAVASAQEVSSESAVDSDPNKVSKKKGRTGSIDSVSDRVQYVDEDFSKVYQSNDQPASIATVGGGVQYVDEDLSKVYQSNEQSGSIPAVGGGVQYVDEDLSKVYQSNDQRASIPAVGGGLQYVDEDLSKAYQWNDERAGIATVGGGVQYVDEDLSEVYKKDSRLGSGDASDPACSQKGHNRDYSEVPDPQGADLAKERKPDLRLEKVCDSEETIQQGDELKALTDSNEADTELEKVTKGVEDLINEGQSQEAPYVDDLTAGLLWLQQRARRGYGGRVRPDSNGTSVVDDNNGGQTSVSRHHDAKVIQSLSWLKKQGFDLGILLGSERTPPSDTPSTAEKARSRAGTLATADHQGQAAARDADPSVPVAKEKTSRWQGSVIKATPSDSNVAAAWLATRRNRASLLDSMDKEPKERKSQQKRTREVGALKLLPDLEIDEETDHEVDCDDVPESDAMKWLKKKGLGVSTRGETEQDFVQAGGSFRVEGNTQGKVSPQPGRAAADQEMENDSRSKRDGKKSMASTVKTATAVRSLVDSDEKGSTASAATPRYRATTRNGSNPVRTRDLVSGADRRIDSPGSVKSLNDDKGFIPLTSDGPLNDVSSSSPKKKIRSRSRNPKGQSQKDRRRSPSKKEDINKSMAWLQAKSQKNPKSPSQLLRATTARRSMGSSFSQIQSLPDLQSDERIVESPSERPVLDDSPASQVDLDYSNAVAWLNNRSVGVEDASYFEKLDNMLPKKTSQSIEDRARDMVKAMNWVKKQGLLNVEGKKRPPSTNTNASASATATKSLSAESKTGETGASKPNKSKMSSSTSSISSTSSLPASSRNGESTKEVKTQAQSQAEAQTLGCEKSLAATSSAEIPPAKIGSQSLDPEIRVYENAMLFLAAFAKGGNEWERVDDAKHFKKLNNMIPMKADQTDEERALKMQKMLNFLKKKGKA